MQTRVVEVAPVLPLLISILISLGEHSADETLGCSFPLVPVFGAIEETSDLHL